MDHLDDSKLDNVKEDCGLCRQRRQVKELSRTQVYGSLNVLCGCSPTISAI